jgi:hypothetical protein
LFQAGLFAPAAAAAEKLAARRPDSVPAREMLVECVLHLAARSAGDERRAQCERAAAQFRELARLRPADLSPVTRLVLLELRFLRSAESAAKDAAPLEEAARGGRLDDDGLDALGLLRLRTGHAAAAVPLLERASAGARPRASPLLHLAEAYGGVGRLVEARRKFLAALRLPMDPAEREEALSLAPVFGISLRPAAPDIPPEPPPAPKGSDGSAGAAGTGGLTPPPSP